MSKRTGRAILLLVIPTILAGITNIILNNFPWKYYIPNSGIQLAVMEPDYLRYLYQALICIEAACHIIVLVVLVWLVAQGVWHLVLKIRNRGDEEV